MLAQSQSSDLYPALNDPDYFSPAAAAGSDSSAQSSVSGNIGNIGGFMNSGSNFVNAAEGFVASATAIGAGTGALYAYGELATVTTTGVGVDFGGSVLLGLGAVSDVGGMAFVGSSLGAGGGIALLPAFGIGWGIGTLLNPYVQPIISSWYGY